MRTPALALSIFLVLLVPATHAIQWPWDRDTPAPSATPKAAITPKRAVAPTPAQPIQAQPKPTPRPGIRWPWLRDTSTPSPNSAKARAQAEAEFKVPLRSTLSGADEVARFLAGMPLPKNSSLIPLTNTPAWQEHAAFFEKTFAKMNVKQLLRLHNWETQYLPESREKIPVAFYMFSGPDFLYVDQVFPKADIYILCGKEAMGPPPDPKRISNLGGALHNLEEAMHSSLRFSFFITKDMRVSLDSQELKGVLPILYVFLARADKSIRDVTYGSLSDSGAFLEGRSGSNPGVRIRYVNNRTGQEQTLYYFNTDISDGGLASSGFLRFCNQFGVGCSLLKASSYLMFEGGFNRIRDFVLDHSKTIVQDDSGIPISSFNPQKWNIRVFGHYVGPIEIFKQHYQPKLKEIFDQISPPPITFHFGYRYNYTQSHVIVASRR
ncbi:MAG TPA: hypothetical protein VH170_01435 [Chthoniobacterales bacterium]|jgi:hypothetical protein|nr:hypothetical protein [Chthoniobacterales bacterium]